MTHFGDGWVPLASPPRSSPSTPVVILCGGRGERLGDLTREIPKPMVDVAGKPILWHVMQHFARHGCTDFTLAVGYLGWVVRDYFSDTTTYGHNRANGWRVHCVSTGWETQNGGRLKLLAYALTGTFFLAWCDGLSDIDLTAMLAYHRAHGKLCTVAAVRPPERFGSLKVNWGPHPQIGGAVIEFREKAQASQWINGGFFICEPGVLGYIDGDETRFELEPMQRLAKDGQLMAYAHAGWWQCMDTEKDRRELDVYLRSHARG